MLDVFRSKSHNFLIYLMFAIIIAVFVFTFGAISPDQACGGAGGLSSTDLAEVDGQIIDSRTIGMVEALSINAPSPGDRTQGATDRMRYYLATRYYRLGLVGPFVSGFGEDPSKISPVSVDKWMADLIETRLVAGYARSLGMSISNTEMNTRLAELVSQFVDDQGNYDGASFQGYIRNTLGTASSTFEAFVKDELLRERIIRLVAGSAQVSDAELKALHALKNTKVQLSQISIDKISAKALVPVTDAEISTWLKTNGELAQGEYDKQKATRFTTPTSYVLRGIKVDAPAKTLISGMDEEQQAEPQKMRDDAKAKADKFLVDVAAALSAPTEEGAEVLSASQRFAAFATTHSDDASKTNGGAIAGAKKAAELRRSPFGEAVAIAVPALKANGVSTVLEVDSGYWILFVETVNAEKVTPFDTAKSEIAKGFVALDKVGDFTPGLADEVLAQAKADPKASLEDVAKAINTKYGVKDGTGLRAGETAPFVRTEVVGDTAAVPYALPIGRSAELVRMAFAATEDNPVLPAVVSIEPGDRLVVARWSKAIAAEDATSEELDALRQDQTRSLQRSIYRGWYDDYLAKKTASGDVEFGTGWTKFRNAQVEAFVDAGGQLPKTMIDAKPAAAN